MVLQSDWERSYSQFPLKEEIFSPLVADSALTAQRKRTEKQKAALRGKAGITKAPCIVGNGTSGAPGDRWRAASRRPTGRLMCV